MLQCTDPRQPQQAPLGTAGTSLGPAATANRDRFHTAVSKNLGWKSKWQGGSLSGWTVCVELKGWSVLTDLKQEDRGSEKRLHYSPPRQPPPPGPLMA